MMESFVPTSTDPIIPASSNLSLLQDDSSGLILVLEAPDETSYEIHFPGHLAYMVTDEGDRLRSMEYLTGRAATPVGCIENSKWKGWFVEESLGIREADQLIHWCIVTPNDIIDIIALESPVVKVRAGNA